MENMNAIYESWAEYLWKSGPKLMSNLYYKELYTIDFYTRLERYPEIKDRRLYFNTFGIMTLCGMQVHSYSDDDMFKIIIETKNYNIFTFTMRVIEFQEPFSIQEETNQLGYFYDTMNGASINWFLAEFCRKIVWNWLHECIYQKYSEERSKILKEELVAKAWAPERVAKWLEAGVNVEDM